MNSDSFILTTANVDFQILFEICLIHKPAYSFRLIKIKILILTRFIHFDSKFK